MRTNPVKAALKNKEPQVGSWLTLASPIAARFMARCGYKWITVDMEHSPAGWETAALLFGAIADAGGVPLVRIAVSSSENVKRALDCGAYGIIFPMCNSVVEAEQAVAWCKYPPAGRRPVGGGLHALNFQTDSSEYFRRANDEILVIIQTEHITAVENCQAIYSVPGIDGMFVGPNDLLSSMGKTPAMESDDPEFVAALRKVRETAARCGIASGIHVADADAAVRRRDEGWQFIAVASDTAFMQSAALAASQRIFGGASKTTLRY